MVLGQVAEGGPGKGHPADALLFQGVGRDLHDGDVHPGLRHGRQHGVHAQGIGRGQGRGLAMTGPAVTHRAQHAHLVSGGREQMLQQIGAGGLAVGAGDAQHAQRQAAGMPAGLGQTPQGLAGIVMMDHRAARGTGGLGFGPSGQADDGGRTGLHGRRDETGAVNIDPGDSHKDVPLADLTRVGADLPSLTAHLVEQLFEFAIHGYLSESHRM